MAFFNISEAIDELHKEKRIPREELVTALESALASAYRKNFGPNAEILVELKDDIIVYQVKNIVEEVEDKECEISLKEAKKLKGTVEKAILDVPVTEGEEVIIPILGWEEGYDPKVDAEPGQKIRWEVRTDRFGRIAAQTAKQVMIQKIREVERKMTYEEFSGRIGELILGRVQRFEKGDIYVDHNGTEICMPYKEQIPGQRYRQGDRVKAVILEVSQTNKGPMVIASRGSREFMKKLFEEEIPEIQDGVVQIRALAREPGVRSKVAVHSLDGNIDPVGACVGLKGSRIQVIVNEVQGEKIDIIHWNDDLKRFVASALSPAKPVSMIYSDDEQKMTVVVPQDQLSLAIGREGQNVRLAAKLTRVKIDILSAKEAAERGLSLNDASPIVRH